MRSFVVATGLIIGTLLNPSWIFVYSPFVTTLLLVTVALWFFIGLLLDIAEIGFRKSNTDNVTRMVNIAGTYVNIFRAQVEREVTWNDPKAPHSC